MGNRISLSRAELRRKFLWPVSPEDLLLYHKTTEKSIVRFTENDYVYEDFKQKPLTFYEFLVKV